MAIRFRILGEAASKANSRRLVKNHRSGGLMSVKSKKALSFVQAASVQVPTQAPLLSGPLSITMTIYYATERPDLDESLVLDALQGRLYANDRQIREKHIFHAIDREQPRVEGFVAPIGDAA